MELNVESFLTSARHRLNRWENDLTKIKEGTFVYDGSMPNSCVDALCEHKVEVLKEVVSYLESLPLDMVIQTSRGLTKEGAKYYELVNS